MLVRPVFQRQLQSCVHMAATTSKRNDGLEADEYDPAMGDSHGLAALGERTATFLSKTLSGFDVHPRSCSGTARLTGRVYCRENVQQWFDIDAVFEGEQIASQWLAEDANHSPAINDDPDQDGYQMCAVNEDEIRCSHVFAEHHDGRWRFERLCVWSTCRSLSTSVSSSEKAPTTTTVSVWWMVQVGWEVNGEEMSGLSGDIVVDLGLVRATIFCQNSCLSTFVLLTKFVGR